MSKTEPLLADARGAIQSDASSGRVEPTDGELTLLVAVLVAVLLAVPAEDGVVVVVPEALLPPGAPPRSEVLGPPIAAGCESSLSGFTVITN